MRDYNKEGDASCEESPQILRGVTPKNARSHPKNVRSHPNHCEESPREWRDGSSPFFFFLNNSISDVIKLRVITVHEFHMGHYQHWRTEDSTSSYFRAILNVGKMRGVTPTDAVVSVGVTPRTKQLGVTPRTPPFEGKKPENQKTIISIRKGRLLLVNDQGFSQIAPT